MKNTKNLLYLLGYVLSIELMSCDSISSQKQQAIQVVQDAKCEQTLIFNSESTTNLEWANTVAQEEPNYKHEWNASDTPEKGIYLVSFTNPEKGGHYWQANVAQKVVQYVNKNDYLSRKYGLTGMISKNMFLNDKLFFQDTIIISNEYWGPYSRRSDDGIAYMMHGNIVNNTGKTITEAKLTACVKLIYKDKTVMEESNSWGLSISVSKPWVNGDTLGYELIAKPIEQIYLNYVPEYVLGQIRMEASDPVGYHFKEVIKEIDLMADFKGLPRNSKRK